MTNTVTRQHAKRNFTSLVNIISQSIQQISHSNPNDTNAITHLQEFRENIQASTSAMIRLNQMLYETQKPILTLSQIRSNLSLMQHFSETYPSIGETIKANMKHTLIGFQPISVEETSSKESHFLPSYITTLQKFNKLVNNLIFEELPSRHSNGILTLYGRELQQKMGYTSFLKAMNLFNNQLIQESDYTPMTEISLDNPVTLNLPFYWCKDKTFVIEQMVLKTEISNPDEILFCKMDQLKLIEKLQNDGKLSNLTGNELKVFKSFINSRNDILVHPKYLKKNAQKSDYLFYKTSLEENHNDITPNLDSF